MSILPFPHDMQEPAASDVVLIVDDVADNCELIDRYLRKHGYATAVCTSGSEALSFVSKTRPQLVLLDWMMPGLSGLDTLLAIREIYDETQLPVIMCTAIDEDVSVVNALRGGANDYVTKPLNLAVLHARVEGQIARVAKMQELCSNKDELEKVLAQRTAALLRASNPGDK